VFRLMPYLLGPWRWRLAALDFIASPQQPEWFVICQAL
jgi:hypothetical protein